MRSPYLMQDTAAAPALYAEPAGPDVLDIDADAFRTHFSRKPFLISHRLAEHPLLSLPKLIELSRRLPADLIEYNAGNIPVSLDPTLTPRTGLSVEETLRRIEECSSWMVLRNVENDPEYRELLHSCLREIRPHSERLFPGMRQEEGFIFVSSPGAVTPCHVDPEHNFLLQVRGSKHINLFDGGDRSIMSHEDLEQFYNAGLRNVKLTEEGQRKAMRFELKPGEGLHFPVMFPHWVKNGNAVSISFSITFRTPDLKRPYAVYNVNAALRRWGIAPTPFGGSSWRDSLKYYSFGVWSQVRRLLPKRRR